MTTALITAKPERQSILRAHDEVLGHVEARIAEGRAHLAELEGGAQHTERGTFGSKALESAMVRERKHLTFLDKVAAALRAGYTLMPNLNLTLLAVRTDRGVPTGLAEERYRGRPSALDIKARALPAGEGRYVSPEPELESWTEQRGTEGKDQHQVTVYQASAHAPVDVPIALVKPELAAALEDALRGKLFDEIGIVQDNARRDPLLVGRILDPRARAYDRRGLSFFLGWWFNPAVLDG